MPMTFFLGVTQTSISTHILRLFFKYVKNKIVDPMVQEISGDEVCLIDCVKTFGSSRLFPQLYSLWTELFIHTISLAICQLTLTFSSFLFFRIYVCDDHKMTNTRYHAAGRHLPNLLDMTWNPGQDTADSFFSRLRSRFQEALAPAGTLYHGSPLTRGGNF